MNNPQEDLEIAEEKVVKKKAAYNLAKILLIGAVGLAVTAILILQTVSILQLQKGRDVDQKTLDSIESCIDPNGTCYKSGNKRQSGAIQLINENQKRVVTIAAFCAKQPGNHTLAQIEDCVNKELKR